jgi:hypothetical protein
LSRRQRRLSFLRAGSSRRSFSPPALSPASRPRPR